MTGMHLTFSLKLTNLADRIFREGAVTLHSVLTYFPHFM